MVVSDQNHMNRPTVGMLVGASQFSEPSPKFTSSLAPMPLAILLLVDDPTLFEGELNILVTLKAGY